MSMLLKPDGKRGSCYAHSPEVLDWNVWGEWAWVWGEKTLAGWCEYQSTDLTFIQMSSGGHVVGVLDLLVTLKKFIIPENPSQAWDLFRRAWNWKDLAHGILGRVESRQVLKSDGMRHRIAWLTIRFTHICHLDSYIPWNKRCQPKTQPKHWVNLDLAQWYTGGACGKGPACQCTPGFDPWVRKILWRRGWQPIPVFSPGESP